MSNELLSFYRCSILPRTCCPTLSVKLLAHWLQYIVYIDLHKNAPAHMHICLYDIIMVCIYIYTVIIQYWCMYIHAHVSNMFICRLTVLSVWTLLLAHTRLNTVKGSPTVAPSSVALFRPWPVLLQHSRCIPQRCRLYTVPMVVIRPRNNALKEGWPIAILWILRGRRTESLPMRYPGSNYPACEPTENHFVHLSTWLLNDMNKG